MATIQIREIPEETYEVIRKRARVQGRSIQSLMRDRVVDFAGQPTPAELMATLEAALAEHETPGATHASVTADLAADRR
ncbi:antitoxin VapB1 [soil metagenome]